MCKIMEEISADREKQKTYRIAMNLLKMGIASHKQIAQATGLTLEEVQALAAMIKTSV